MKIAATKNYYRIRLKAPAGFIKKSFRTIPLKEGVKLIRGKIPGEKKYFTQAAIFSKKTFKEPRAAAAWIKKHPGIIKNPCTPAPAENSAVHIGRELSELYRTFHGADHKKIGAVDLNIETGLIRLGSCDGILYRSKKHGGIERAYIHKFSKPYPDLFSDVDGDALIIKGGFEIKSGGITG
jgi:hypothetical protein